MASKNFELKNPESGLTTSLPVRSGTIGPDVLDISNLNRDHGVFTYDPAFAATASCDSKITYIDGDAGVLLYRGYPVEQLAEKSTFMEVAYLLIYGELPSARQLAGVFRQHRPPHHDQRIAAAILQRFSSRCASDGDGIGGGGVDVGVLSRLHRHP